MTGPDSYGFFLYLRNLIFHLSLRISLIKLSCSLIPKYVFGLDGGGEFTSNNLNITYPPVALSINLVVHTHPSNVSERKHRHLLDMTRTLLILDYPQNSG